MKPKVSICIPAYKQINYLRKTLESISTQKYNNYEIIITDDSPDESVKNLLKKFNFSDKLKYFHNKTRLGSPENWNEAIRRASGEYIKILHHDDWFKGSDSLSKFVKMLELNPESDFAFSASEAMNSEKKFLFIHSVSKYQLKLLKKDPAILFFKNFIGAPSTTIYRKTINLEYDKKIKWLVDVDMYIRILKNNKTFIYHQDPLIQITADGTHQVTQEVRKDEALQIRENLYLYDKIQNNTSLISKILFLFTFLKYPSFLDFQKKIKYKLNDMPIELYIMMIIKKIKLKITEKIKRVFSSKKKSFNISYSQCGEDIIVEYIFKQLRIERLSYLDLGAHHPIYLSNTYLFYKNGSTGVCVEPDLVLFNYFKKKRNRDVCLNVGVGFTETDDNSDFYVMSEKSLNTFSKKEAERFVKNEGQKIESVIKIPLISVNQIISENFDRKPNFISIDIEGLDFDVLRSFDFEKYRPEVFCIETLTFVKNSGEQKLNNIIDLMKNKDYFVYADTYINTIFVDINSWNNRKND